MQIVAPSQMQLQLLAPSSAISIATSVSNVVFPVILQVPPLLMLPAKRTLPPICGPSAAAKSYRIKWWSKNGHSYGQMDAPLQTPFQFLSLPSGIGTNTLVNSSKLFCNSCGATTVQSIGPAIPIYGQRGNYSVDLPV